MYVIESKSNKQILLRKCFKALEMFKKYRQFQWTANVQVLRMRKNIDHMYLKACYQAIKQNSMQGRLVEADNLLNEDVLPGIQNTHKDIVNHGDEMLVRQTRISCNVMVNMLGRSLHSYFAVWKSSTAGFKVNIGTKLRFRLIHLYQNRLLTAFNKWAAATNHQEIGNKL